MRRCLGKAVLLELAHGCGGVVARGDSTHAVGVHDGGSPHPAPHGVATRSGARPEERRQRADVGPLDRAERVAQEVERLGLGPRLGFVLRGGVADLPTAVTRCPRSIASLAINPPSHRDAPMTAIFTVGSYPGVTTSARKPKMAAATASEWVNTPR